MNIIVANRIVENYFRFMKNWDTEIKKNLIKKLTASITKKSIDKYNFSSTFGAWEDSRNADDIINEIRTNRINNREIEEL